MKIAKFILVVALIIVAIVVMIVLFKIGLLADSIRDNDTQIATDFHNVAGASITAINRGSDLEQSLHDVTQGIIQQTATQAADLQKTQLQVYKAITDMKEIVVRTNKSLNDVLVPELSASLLASTALQTSAMRNLTETTTRIDATIDALQPGIDGMNKATAAAAIAMADPAIHETLTHVEGVSGNVDATTGDIRAFVHRETSPVTGTWNVIKAFLREFAGPAAQVATAVK